MDVFDVGLMRSLQPVLFPLLGVLALLTAALLAGLVLAKGHRSTVIWLYLGAVLLSLGFAAVKGAAIATQNRLPRQDVDGSGVYRQMEGLRNKADENASGGEETKGTE